MSFLNFDASDNFCMILTTTNDKILGFLGLPQGWHYGEGNSPSEETITKSVQINNEANLLALKTEAFPGINGEIQINCYKDNETLEFIIEPNGDVSFVLEDEIREIESRENLSIEEALNSLKDYGKKIWNLSDRSIQITMTSTEEDLSVWHSKIPLMEAEYRLFPSLV